MGDSGRDDAQLVGVDAEGFPRKLEVGAALQLQEELRPVVVVHPTVFLDQLHLMGNLQADLVALGEFDRPVKDLAHFGAVVRTQPLGGKDACRFSFFSHGDGADT